MVMMDVVSKEMGRREREREVCDKEKMWKLKDAEVKTTCELKVAESWVSAWKNEDIWERYRTVC